MIASYIKIYYGEQAIRIRRQRRRERQAKRDNRTRNKIAQNRLRQHYAVLMRKQPNP